MVMKFEHHSCENCPHERHGHDPKTRKCAVKGCTCKKYVPGGPIRRGPPSGADKYKRY